MIALVFRVALALVSMESPLTHAIVMLGLLAPAVKQVSFAIRFCETSKLRDPFL